jgi:hypothetical protein
MSWPVIGWMVSRSENKFILRKLLEGGFRDPKVLPRGLLEEFNKVGFRRGYRRGSAGALGHRPGPELALGHVVSTRRITKASPSEQLLPEPVAK